MDDQEDFLEKKMYELFEKTKCSFSKYDIDEINDYINHGECGVAFYHICFQLYNYSVPISNKTYDLIEQIGKFLEYKESKWSHLKELIIE